MMDRPCVMHPEDDCSALFPCVDCPARADARDALAELFASEHRDRAALVRRLAGVEPAAADRVGF